MDQHPPQYKRRVRYSGTHPRNYKDKYKELQPEKYPETVEKVISKGSTPVGMHIPIMVQEILDILQIQPGQTGLDATLGYGGHSSRMLQCLDHKGHLYALDIDTLEMQKTGERLAGMGFGPDILTIRQLNFAHIDRLAQEAGRFDFVLADLGVSSMQIDNPDRGFSYKTDGPLDLRLDSAKGISAAQRLKNITQEELQGMLTENADEPYADRISRAVIHSMRKGNPVDTTSGLRQIIEHALSFLPEADRKVAVKKSCQRTFQALRIDINNEYEVLYEFMDKLPGVLKEGGRAAILTFHSGEDRIVKKSFKQGLKAGIYSDAAEDVIRPSAQECIANSRAHSTKLRWAVRA